MKLQKTAFALAAFSLIAAPVAAQSFRTAAPAPQASELEGNSQLFLVLGAAAAVAAVIIAASDDSDPVSS